MRRSPSAITRISARIFPPSSAAPSATAARAWPPTRRARTARCAFWPNPLLSKDYIRASCGRCHKEGEVPGVPELTAGRHLFETQGCRGCHKLNGVGGSIGPDLTGEGANRRAPEWLEAHFLAPNAVSAGSAMPNFHFTKEQARDLTYYMLSLTNEEMGSYFSSLRLIPSPEYRPTVICREELHQLPLHWRRWSKDRSRPAGCHQAPLHRMA